MQNAALWIDSASLKSEDQMVEAAKLDRTKFAELYERHVDGIYSYLRVRAADEQDAADLTQQVFLQALAALPRYRSGKTPFAAWLYRIARNTAINHAKRSRKRSVNAGHLSGALETAVDTDYPGQIERRERVAKLLRGLDDDARELLALRFGADLSCAEIAAVRGKNEAAIRMRITRILQSLRETHDNDDR